MSDRELIERAAMAAGLEIATARQAERDSAIGREASGLWLKDGKTWWNPLADDGDALRLAVRLRINFSDNDLWLRYNDLERYDPEAATRRVITNAAAAIWEAAP